MKMILSGLITALAMTAHATKKVEFKTMITCQQGDGDQWYEVGIAPINGDKVFNAFIVYHDTDTDSAKLVGQLKVTGGLIPSKKGYLALYTGNNGMFKLGISQAPRTAFIYGNLSYQIPGQQGLAIQNMDCYVDSKISFEPPLKLK